LSYRKFKSAQLFTGTTMLGEEDVLITDTKGKVADIVPLQDAGDDIQHFHGLLTPGFVNTHCHLELSHMKGLIPEHTGLVDFVFKVVSQRHFPQDEIEQAIKDGEDEILRNGIVAVGDICNNILTLSQKKQERLHYYNFIEVSGWLPAVATSRYEKSKEYFTAYNELTGDYHQSAMVPHAPYSVSNELWQLLQQGFTGKTISIHNQETTAEADFFKDGSGDFLRMYQMMQLDNSFFQAPNKSSLQYYFERLSAAKNALLVHNTFSTKEDVQFAQHHAAMHQQQLFFCLCINANLYIENEVPPVELLREQQCNITLGTDSLASNHGLNIWDEIQTLRKRFPALPLEELLQWATINGAKALQLDHVLGSFEKGKQPGIVFIEANSQNLTPQRVL